MWSCVTHGVRDWDFGTDAHWSVGPAPPHPRIGAPTAKAAPEPHRAPPRTPAEGTS